MPSKSLIHASKASRVRNYILDSIESGKFQLGKRLPGAKKLASELNISHAIVQSVVDSLSSEGVLYAVPRGGSYIHQNWNKRILQNNFTTTLNNRPWYGVLQEIFTKQLPEIWLTSQFCESVFEIRTTTHVQAHHNEYLDLSPLLDECIPDKSDLEMTPFSSFYFDGKLVGLPFMYSPRVMFYNPEVLSQNGCKEPETGWNWDDFLDMVRQLRGKIEPERIIEWIPDLYYWMNFLVRGGGCLINPKLADPVRLDSEESIESLRKVQQLGQLVNRTQTKNSSTKFFESGTVAFCVGGRERLSVCNQQLKGKFKTVALPLIPGGEDTTMQITDLFCIRKNCCDLTTAKKLIKIMLSSDFQDFLAKVKYGIPIRKSSAAKTLDASDPIDALFIRESQKVKRTYNIDSVDLHKLIKNGIKICLMSDADIAPPLRKLADVVKTYMAIRNNSWNLNNIK